MAFDYAYIHQSKCPVLIDEFNITILIQLDDEFLLIYSRGRKQCHLNPENKPVGFFSRVFAYLLDILGFMLLSLVFSVSYRNTDNQSFTVSDFSGCVFAAEGSRPAGVKLQLLRIEYQLLAVISDSLVQVIGLFSYDCEFMR